MSFKTIMFFVLGLIFPLWPISLPLFWYLAFRSSKQDKIRQQEMFTQATLQAAKVIANNDSK